MSRAAQHGWSSATALPHSLLHLLLLALLLLSFGREALAQDGGLASSTDGEACLACHRFPGLARLDEETDELRLFFVSEQYYAHSEGPHARVECTGCHARDEVDTIPHDVVTPVDCTQACHLTTAADAPITFSHAAVQERIEQSVHSHKALTELPFVDSPLREGQSSCLFCHDQPVFRDVDGFVASHRGVDPATRCKTCHDEELPVDIDYYLHHTAARLDSARPVQQTAQVCATCHANQALLGHMEQHDAVTSYFRSFHGKANLLGGKDTATCVDCHRTEAGDVHLVLDSEHPDSMTNPANLELTCRTAGCHPTAVPELSAASVHMEIDPYTITPEYVVIVIFVLLVLFEVGQNLVLILLELINLIVRREHTEHRQLEALAEALQEHPEGRKLVERQTVNQRFQHWLLVVFFGGLVASGMPMRLAHHPISQWFSEAMGGVHVLRMMHRVCAAALFVVFFYHMSYVAVLAVREFLRRRREEPERGLVKNAFYTIWDAPIMMHPRDVLQYAQLFLHLLGLRKHRPERPKFHYGEKVEYVAVAYGMIVIGISGAILWGENWMPGLLGGRALNFAYIVHSYEAFLAALYVIVAHMFVVILMPAAFPLSLGSLTGQMPTEELAEGHSGHLKEVAAELGVEMPAPLPPRSWLSTVLRKLYALALIPVVAIVGFVALRYLVEETLGARVIVDADTLPLTLTSDDLVENTTDARRGALSSSAMGAGGARSERYQRGPLSHFHVIPTWFSADEGNTCAGAGCHEALPHGERKETRAFLNMHSTFIDCQVCHLEKVPAPSELGWVGLDSWRTASPIPATLSLMEALQEPLSEDATALATQDRELRALLTRAIEESGGQEDFRRWLLDLERSRLGGPVYVGIVADIRGSIELHGHGEYGAKIGLPGSAWKPDTQGRDAARRLSVEPMPTGDVKDKLVETVHSGLAEPESLCTHCHDDKPDAIDFEALGYSPNRARSLRANTIVRQAQAIERDEVFHLPNLMGGPRQPTTPETDTTAPDQPGLESVEEAQP